MSDTVSIGLSAVNGVVTLLLLVAGVVAVARLKATPSGLLLGGGFGTMAFCGLGSKLYYWVAVRPVLRDPGADYVDTESVMTTLHTINLGSAVVTGVLWIVVAVGLITLPASLERLRASAR